MQQRSNCVSQGGVENAEERNWLVTGSTLLEAPREPSNDGCERNE